MKNELKKLAMVLSLLVPGSLMAQHSGAAAARPALTPSREASQFDFLIGQWELVVTPKVNSVAARIHGAPQLGGTWKAWRAVDGFGIEDELRVIDRSGNPNALSHALRVYSPTERKWLVTAIDAYRGKTSGSTGEWKNGEMVSISQGVDEEGKPYVTRTRYFDITPTAFKFQQDRSADNGKTWDEGTLRMEAKRVAATAPR